MENKKLEFYGGEWMSFLPLGLFLVGIIYTTFFVGSISDGALWLPAFLACALFTTASDTTVCSATSQGVDVPGVVRSRFKYSATAAIITIIAIFIIGPMTRGSIEPYRRFPKL